MKAIILAMSIGIAAISVSQGAGAATAVGFSPTLWGAADGTFGVAGFVIEDFEDTDLAAGLQVEVASPSLGSYGPTATLPFTFDPVTDDTFGTVFNDGVWDGTHALVNRPALPITNYDNDGGWSDVTFLFAAGVHSVGFSIAQADGPIAISIDVGGGLSPFADSTDFLSSSSGRGGYLRIDAEPGELIYAVMLDNQLGNHDGIVYDHLAFQPVPLPAAAGLFGAALGVLGLSSARRRRQPPS